jgi:hypothetical protein
MRAKSNFTVIILGIALEEAWCYRRMSRRRISGITAAHGEPRKPSVWLLAGKHWMRPAPVVAVPRESPDKPYELAFDKDRVAAIASAR